MDTWEAITSRRQVRQFTDDPIAPDDLTKILEAGRRAPSSRNGQPWDFVVVSDRDQLRQLSGVWQHATWMAESAVAIALVMPSNVDSPQQLIGRFDLGQAAMQMMITATSLGVASGQAICMNQALAQNVLGFPDDKHCALLIALGYPAERPLRPIKAPSRRDFADVVHFDTW